MNSFLPVIFLMVPAMSFHSMFIKTINKVLRHYPADPDTVDSIFYNQNQLHEFKSRMILGVVDSIAAEIAGYVPPDSLIDMGFDDVVSTVPHSVLADVLDNPVTTVPIAQHDSKEFRLILVPVDTYEVGNTTAIFVRNVTLHSAPLGNLVWPFPRHRSKRGASVASMAFRYLLPPIAFQVIPHLVVQVAIHFAHDQYLYVQHLAHFFNFAITGNII